MLWSSFFPETGEGEATSQEIDLMIVSKQDFQERQ